MSAVSFRRGIELQKKRGMPFRSQLTRSQKADTPACRHLPEIPPRRLQSPPKKSAHDRRGCETNSSAGSLRASRGRRVHTSARAQVHHQVAVSVPCVINAASTAWLPRNPRDKSAIIKVPRAAPTPDPRSGGWPRSAPIATGALLCGRRAQRHAADCQTLSPSFDGVRLSAQCFQLRGIRHTRARSTPDRCPLAERQRSSACGRRTERTAETGAPTFPASEGFLIVL